VRTTTPRKNKRNSEGCYYRILDVNVSARTADMIVKFEPNARCLNLDKTRLSVEAGAICPTSRPTAQSRTRSDNDEISGARRDSNLAQAAISNRFSHFYRRAEQFLPTS
jgi:hypothetical protein